MEMKQHIWKLRGEGCHEAASPADIAKRLAECRQPQTPTSGFAALMGTWPGDETEEELLAALEDIS